jgi:hypothetical protein
MAARRWLRVLVAALAALTLLAAFARPDGAQTYPPVQTGVRRQQADAFYSRPYSAGIRVC